MEAEADTEVEEGGKDLGYVSTQARAYALDAEVDGKADMETGLRADPEAEAEELEVGKAWRLGAKFSAPNINKVNATEGQTDPKRGKFESSKVGRERYSRLVSLAVFTSVLLQRQTSSLRDRTGDEAVLNLVRYYSHPLVIQVFETCHLATATNPVVLARCRSST